MTLLIDQDTVGGVSLPFTVPFGGQLTLFALGLSGAEVIEFEIVRYTDPMNNGCACPPLAFEPLAPQSVAQLQSCNGPLQLSPTRPFLILDAPQGVPLRARFVGASPVVGQQVWFENTNTPTPTDYMRGYDCP